MRKRYSYQEALSKIQRYCAYQERAHSEVREKLFEYGIYEREVDEILAELITSGFLNEERFAKAFAGGKFRMKKWGRIKIIHALEAKGVSPNCIRSGLKELDDAAYAETLHEILTKKNQELAEDNIYSHRDRLAKYAIQKGYEPELTWAVVKTLLPDQR
jgi:regulatory protein